jgi:glutamyl-tRNA reductase
MVHHLVCLGLSHHTAPVELRERIGALGPGAERCPAVLEHAVLQTCYRVELYARLTSGVEDARDELVDALSTVHGVSRELLLDHLYVHSGDGVARHLCRVASGLDSLVLGEAEILGQVRGAFEAGIDDRTVGPGLTLLFRTAISAARRARADTAIGANPTTASSMALALAEGVLGDLGQKQLLVIGAGRIGLQTLKAAEGRQINRIAVANRTEARAREVSGRFGASAHGLDELETVLAEADVAIAATSSESSIVSAEVVSAAIARRPARPLVLVDLAVPADVERDAGAIAGVRLFDVDDLRIGLDDAMASRLQEVPRVEAIVDEEVEGFGRRYRELEIEPLLSELRKHAESTREREVERVLRDLGDLDPLVAERLELLSRTLVKKLLHDPTVRARERAGAGDADEVADAVRDLFGISAPSDP